MPVNPMRALLVCDEVRAEIEKVKEYAHGHPLEYPELLLRSQGRMASPPLGDIPGYSLLIPQGYRAVYTYEEAMLDKMCRHLSVSVDEEKGVFPSVDAVRTIAVMFGFELFPEHFGVEPPPPPEGPVIWIENDKAINVLEPEDGVWPAKVKA